MTSTDQRRGPHQSRLWPPPPYEARLASTIEEIFGSGVHDLPGLVLALNTSGIAAPDGTVWGEASLAEQIQTLAADISNMGPKRSTTARAERPMAPKVPLSAEMLMALGMRNRWYAICPSSDVNTGALLQATRFGIDWVIMRCADGSLSMLEDRCPHRGAALSLGSHLGDRVQCVYHGVQVGGDGTVVAVPGMPGCGLEGKRLVASLPVVEQADAIFAYLGDETHPDPVPFGLPVPLADPENSHFLAYVEWECGWRYAVENVLDPSHGAFLHRESHTMGAGEFAAEYRIEETDDGFMFEKTTQRDVNFDWVAYHETGADWLELSIPYPRTAGPGGPFGIVGMVTPIDAGRSAVSFWRYRKASGWERDVWRFLYKTSIEERHFAVLEQDRRLLESLAADADQHENLYQHDLGIVRYRRMLRREADRQASALAAIESRPEL